MRALPTRECAAFRPRATTAGARSAGGEAAKAFHRSGECYAKIKNEHDAATSYIECARCYIKAGDGKAGTEMLETEALPRIVDSGRLSQAAKLHGEVAEMFEQEGQFADAIKHFQQAADLHSAENANSSALKATERIAHLSAQLDPPDWEAAAANFERVGTESLASNLLKFGAKSAFFNAYLCTLARGDVVAAERDLEKYKEQDYTFPGCREAKLADDILAAYKDLNVEAFTDAIVNYDAISKLTPWRTRCGAPRCRGGLSGAAADGVRNTAAARRVRRRTGARARAARARARARGPCPRPHPLAHAIPDPPRLCAARCSRSRPQ